jgi:superfamily I DNA/RNA helicase
MYVAATRAIDRLYLMEADQYATDRPLEFLKMTHHEMKSRIILSSRESAEHFLEYAAETRPRRSPPPRRGISPYGSDKVFA